MSDNELPPLPDECEAWWWPKTVVDGVNEWGRAVEQAAYERAAKECKRRWKGGYPQEVVDDCAAAIRALGRQR